MSKSLLFNSLTAPVPSVRGDLHFFQTHKNGREWICFYDDLGYVEKNFALDARAEPVLSLLTDGRSIREISDFFEGNPDAEDLLEFVRLLDRNRVLESDFYKVYSADLEEEFEKSKLRPAVLAGESYPENPDEFKQFLGDLFGNSARTDMSHHPVPRKALFAPHIDLRVGSRQYSEAFSLLRNLKPERVVILATSHYAGCYPKLYDGCPFIGSVKNFQLPGRTLQSDTEIMQKLASVSREKNGFSLHDRAHRVEHSIELHLLFAEYIWRHDFTIVPVLVSGFDELFYHPGGDLARKINTFSEQMRQLDDKNTFFLISGDLSHTGKKFGDPFPAAHRRSDVELTDSRFLASAAEGNDRNVLGLLSESYDATRICGFSPLYTFLKIFPGLKGNKINYLWWDESARESAVSFGSIGY